MRQVLLAKNKQANFTALFWRSRAVRNNYCISRGQRLEITDTEPAARKAGTSFLRRKSEKRRTDRVKRSKDAVVVIRRPSSRAAVAALSMNIEREWSGLISGWPNLFSVHANFCQVLTHPLLRWGWVFVFRKDFIKYPNLLCWGKNYGLADNRPNFYFKTSKQNFFDQFL